MPPVALGRQVYCTFPTSSLEASLLVTFWMRSKAPGPRTMNSPMWLTSNTPTALRTVRCSSLTPVY